MSTMIIPADAPAYVPVGGNELMLLGEFSRTVTLQCDRCGVDYGFKLVADELLSEQRCDEVLDAHLRDGGWSLGDVEICPTCDLN
jgi:hypothetical protein